MDMTNRVKTFQRRPGSNLLHCGPPRCSGGRVSGKYFSMRATMPKILYSSLLMLLIAVGSGAKSINWSRQDSRQSPAVKSKYVDPAVYDGLFVVVSGDWRFDRRELVISYVDSEIEQKPNDPGAATKPVSGRHHKTSPYVSPRTSEHQCIRRLRTTSDGC